MHFLPRDSEPSGQIRDILGGIHFQLGQEALEAVASQAPLVRDTCFCLLDSTLHLVSCKPWAHFRYTTTVTSSGNSNFCNSSSIISLARS